MCHTVAWPSSSRCCRGEPRSLRLVGVDDGVLVAGARVDDDDGQAWRQGDVGVIEHVRLDDDDHAVDGLFAEAAERHRHLTLGEVLHGEQGDRVSGCRGRHRDGVESAHVSVRRQREHDDAESAEAAGAEGSCSAVRTVAELVHGRHDAIAGGLPNIITSYFTPNMYAYNLSFAGQQFNYSATVAIVMGVITAVIAYVVQLRGSRKEDV